MKTITRYILKEFLHVFILTLVAFISLYLLIDFFEKIDDLVEHNATWYTVLQFFIYKIPLIFYQVAPVAVLLATIISLGMLSRHNEVTAIKASGISILRVTVPILISSWIVCVVAFAVNEGIAPVTNQRLEVIKRIRIEGKADTTVFQQGRVWHRGDRIIYNMRYLDPRTKTIRGFTLYELDSAFNLIRRIDAGEVPWTGKGWLVKEGILREFKEGGLIHTTPLSNWTLPIPERPQDFERLERLAEEMGFQELRDYLKRLKREGYKPVRYMVDLHNKLSFPMVSVIVALLGVPFAVKGGRHSGIAVGVGLSFIIGFSYWVIFAINTSLGYSGILPPVIASWLTNIIFGALGVLMFTYVRQ